MMSEEQSSPFSVQAWSPGTQGSEPCSMSIRGSLLIPWKWEAEPKRIALDFGAHESSLQLRSCPEQGKTPCVPPWRRRTKHGPCSLPRGPRVRGCSSPWPAAASHCGAHTSGLQPCPRQSRCRILRQLSSWQVRGSAPSLPLCGRCIMEVPLAMIPEAVSPNWARLRQAQPHFRPPHLHMVTAQEIVMKRYACCCILPRERRACQAGTEAPRRHC